MVKSKAPKADILQEISDDLLPVKVSKKPIIGYLDSWEGVQAPESYIEAQAGKYVEMLEALLNACIKMGDVVMVRTLLNDLIRMTRVGRSKAEVNIGGVNKLREEIPFDDWSEEKIREFIKQRQEERDND